MTAENPATVPPTMIPVWTLGTAVASATRAAETPAAVASADETLVLDELGGRHPSIE